MELDPDDIESRYHLVIFAFQDGRISEAIKHAPLLIRSLLNGRKTPSNEPMEGLALSVVQQLRESPPAFQRRFLESPPELADQEGEIFIRRLLQQRGDEEEIIFDAADDLLNGIVISESPLEPSISAEPDEPRVNLIASLRAVVESEGLNPEKLTVAFEADRQDHLHVADKHSVNLYDGHKAAVWKIPSLRELFRGDGAPPRVSTVIPRRFASTFLILKIIFSLCATREVTKPINRWKRSFHPFAAGPMAEAWETCMTSSGKSQLCSSRAIP